MSTEDAEQCLGMLISRGYQEINKNPLYILRNVTWETIWAINTYLIIKHVSVIIKARKLVIFKEETW